MQNYRSTISLSAAGDQTVVQWSSTFDPDPGEEDNVTGMIEGVYQAGIDHLKQRFGG